MNGKHDAPADDIVVLKLMEEIEGGEEVTQRGLSQHLGIALGLVNTYIKHLVKKGHVRIAQFPRARYHYLLTPEGMAEKSRLVYKHLSYYNNLFKTVRTDCRRLFRGLEAQGVRTIAFCGADEVCEIAFLSLQETGMTLAGVYDDDTRETMLLGFEVQPLSKIGASTWDAVFVASLKGRERLVDGLLKAGVPRGRIVHVGMGEER